jgi:curved DNA-binding protein CbpA
MQMTAELAVRKREIQEKAAKFEKEDYYALLGVTKDMPSTEVQKAFFMLAKKWHPDRVPAALADMKESCAKIFARMSEAHQTLTDPTKRAKYDSAHGAGGDDSPEAQAQVQAILEAATNFQKAEICLRRNDFKQAEDLCRKAIAAEPNQADYITMMAWLQIQKPDRQDTPALQAAVLEFTRAVGISQACERAFFYRAQVLKRLGQEGPAMKDFKRSIELNPRNVDAQREVRLYNMRGGDKARGSASTPPSKKGDEGGGGGLFGKLFKK